MSGLAPLLAAAPAGSRFGPHFGDLLNQLRHAGPKRLMVITDFDQTLTTYFGKDGQLGDQCHDIILHHLDLSEVSPEVAQTLRELNEWNHITESERMARCGNDPLRRSQATRQWFERFHKLSSEEGLKRFAKHCVAKSNVRAREKIQETFKWLETWDVPLLLVSAGLRELLVPVLENAGAPLPSNLSLLANSLDEATVSVTSREKQLALERVPDFKLRAQDRSHVLLLGDKPSDCSPLEGLPESPALKVGFLGQPSEDRFEEYLKFFYAVLVGDASMDFVNCLLDTVSSTSVM
ncbi:Cytosolic 5'-nucleotidase 3A (7-methylguanosine phosphate-specific 5'-nucleotidase) (7-methylguanosine nucleotidase) (Cytosolic 5'-nucleotidase 3) (Cytosolic 5'-nucleotidase III) (cN-III) (Pyrimidine 5'-nucleotidase 1) (P5'N-1) (P5N-1) (PN-I) [Durusdinium trenchii]